VNAKRRSGTKDGRLQDRRLQDRRLQDRRLQDHRLEDGRLQDRRLGELVDALMLAAADAEEQAASLPAFRRIAAEIRSGKSVALLDEQLRKENLLPEEVCQQVRRIDELFDAILARGDEQLLGPAGLHRSPLWRELRAVARQALLLLGIDRRPPGRLP
jgi:hypothetical protein